MNWNIPQNTVAQLVTFGTASNSVGSLPIKIKRTPLCTFSAYKCLIRIQTLYTLFTHTDNYFNNCTLWFKKNVPTLADYNYDPVQSILIIFSKLFVNDHKSCLVGTSPHMCCHYTLWNTMLYFALITLLIARNAPTSDHHITSISVKEF